MNRRLKSLAVLQRLHDVSLKEKAAELTELQGRLSIVITAREELEHKRVHETAVSLPEAMPYVATFIRHIRREDGRLSQAQDALTGHVERVRTDVMERYRDLKSVENLQEVIQGRIRDERETMEAMEMDEINLIGYAKRSVPV